MNKELFLEEKYIKTKKKYRKIVTYVDGENLLREKHERIVSLLKQECSDSIFASVYKGIHIKTTKNGLPTY